jgi:hypothetical protein
MSYIGKSPAAAALVSSDITDGIISTAKIATDAITEAKIADDAVLSAHIGAGDFTFPSGSLIIGTAGKGIDFSAHGDGGTVTGELLDEYEEGTFTPATSGFSYTYNTGYYKKIGNLVYIQAYVIVDTRSSGSRSNIGGLPFTSESHHADSRYPLSVARWSSLNVSTISLNPFVTNNATTIGMDGEASSAAGCDTNIEVWGDDCQMTIAGCYMAA